MLTGSTGAGWRSARVQPGWCSCERQYKREVRHGVETCRQIMYGFEVGLHAQIRLDCETRSARGMSEHANPAKSVQRDGFQAEKLLVLIMAKPRRTIRSRCLRFIEVVIRETPVEARKACKQGTAEGAGNLYFRSYLMARSLPSYGTRCIRRTSKRISSHSTTVPSMRRKGRPTVVCQFWGDFSMRLLMVSRI